MKLEAIVNHETSRIHSTCIVVSRAQAQHLHKGARWLSCVCMVAQLLALLALQPHSKKVMGSIPAWGAVGSGGQVLPRVHSAQVGYLPGLSVWSLHVLPVFTRGFL